MNVQDKILFQQETSVNAVGTLDKIEVFLFPKEVSSLVATPHLPSGSSCFDSPYGCCHDNVTVSPSLDRRGCPGMSNDQLIEYSF